MELNSFSNIYNELKEKYSKQSSLLRGFDAIAFFSFLVAIFQIIYSAITGAYPFESMISSICGSLGFLVLVIALRFHLTPSIDSTVTQEGSFVEFLFCLTLLFLFVWNFMN